MDRRYKVKHYRSRIYNPIRGKVIKAALAVFAAGLLFALGWFGYEPLMEKINSANKEIIENNPVAEPEPEKKPAESAPDFIDKETLAVTVPTEKFYNSMDYYNFLISLDKEVTAVAIDMKTAAGEVTYRSKQAGVAGCGTASENAVDLSARIKTARDLGFDVIARIYAFEDAAAPYKAYDMAIRYESEEGVLWLDDSVDNGGKPWLNPYSDTAQKYILDIVCDAVDAGADAILLDGVRFPDSGGMDYAYFGANADEISRKEVLEQFAKRIYSAAVTSETDILIAYDGFEAISGNEEIYGGSPATLQGDALSPVIDLKKFVGRRVNSDFYYKNMPEDISELAEDIYTSLGYATDKKIYPVLITEGLEKTQLAALKRVFGEQGAFGFVIVYDGAFFTDASAENGEAPEDGETPPETNSQPQNEIPYVPPQSSSSAAESVPESSSGSSSSETSSESGETFSESGESSSQSSSNAWNGSGPIKIGGD